MAIKELHTRIALRYDSYSNWTSSPGKDLILLKGEIGICEIPSLSVEATAAPTVLFKVGDGTNTFENLKWASALAADVYSWAKAETVVLESNVIKFKIGDTAVHTIELNSFATDTEVVALAARISALEGASSGDNITAEQFNALDSRLDVLEGSNDTEGSVANAIKVAEDYTDSEVAKLNVKHAELASSVSGIDKAIAAESYAREQADAVISAKIGAGFDDVNTVEKAIEKAVGLGRQGINDAATVQASLTALTSSGAVAQNAASIAQVSSSLENLINTFEEKNTDHENRIKGIEAFFEAADHDGEDTGSLKDALDTLVEIQEYLSGEGSATGGLLNRMTEAETDIKALEATLAPGGTFERRVTNTEASIAANATAIGILQKLTADYEGEGAIKTAINKVQADATKGIGDAATAQSTADSAKSAAAQAQNQINTLSTLVSNVQAVANNNAANLAALTSRVDTVEESIATLHATVITGENSNKKLREAITSLQDLTGDGGTLRSELADLQETVEQNTNSISGAMSRIAAIESDYLTSEDEFIFQCGTSAGVSTT